MRVNALILTPIVVVVAAAGQAHADLSIVSSVRRVSASAWPTVNTLTAQDLSPWVESVDVNVPYDNIAAATQSSSITPTSISSIGSAMVNDGGNASPGLSSHSVFEVTFDVASPTSFSFVGSWRASVDGNFFSSGAQILLERLSPDPFVFHQSRFRSVFDPLGSVTSGSADLSGVFTPGQYHLYVVASMSGGTNNAYGSRSSQHNVTLTIPSPGAIAIFACAGLRLSRRRR